MIKRIFRYLNGTRNFGLCYNKYDDNIFDAFVDASYSDDPSTGKSTTGYIIRYRGNIIMWRSKLQRIITKSTAQAEYVAISDASDDLLFLSRLTEEILTLTVFPVTVYEDNTACITQCEKTTSHGRLKYIEKKYLEIQQLFEQGLLNVHKIDTKLQLADILTKPLAIDKFQSFACQLTTSIS